MTEIKEYGLTIFIALAFVFGALGLIGKAITKSAEDTATKIRKVNR